MAQRGGAVLAHLRISSEFIESDLIPRGRADAILSMEPLESLRYLEYLKPEGSLITASDAVENIPDYPNIEALHKAIKELPGAKLIDAKSIAIEAGAQRAVNMVLVGAMSAKTGYKT